MMYAFLFHIYAVTTFFPLIRLLLSVIYN